MSARYLSVLWRTMTEWRIKYVKLRGSVRFSKRELERAVTPKGGFL